MAKFKDAIGYVLDNEGGYSEHPSDPGGETFWGISLRYLKGTGEYGDIDDDGDIDADDIRAMTMADAEGFYFRDFWTPLKLDKVESQAVATRVFDMAVNMGLRAAVKIAQKASNTFAKALHGKAKAAYDELVARIEGDSAEIEPGPNLKTPPESPGPNLKVDGKIGPKTIKRLNQLGAIDPIAFMVTLREKHAAFYKALVKKNPSLRVFLNGWLRRANR